ncbi:MAG: hypothetical protein IJP00_01170 [Firmicutes bacterium]|nr:hypothetical protein [Bacillota bacterium]
MSLTMVLVPAAAALTVAGAETVSQLQERKISKETEDLQEYTYSRIMNNLTENMAVESEEVLEDESILLTITLE